jgi:hypothetical protein
MVTYLCRWDHAYTLKSLNREKLFKILSYDDAFRAKSLPSGTYFFTDLDRLGVWELELAGIIYRLLKQAGADVFNDPVKARTRYSLLRALHLEGVNSFQVYRPSLSEWPERYPVFVRRDHFHSGVLSELIEDEKSLREALVRISNDGIPDSNLMVVEYAAEPTSQGIFQKHAVYRIGDRYFRDLTVNQNHWVAKYGELGVAGEKIYQDELDNMRHVPFLETIQEVFEIANIEYGRVDFGIVAGKPQFYEINTNPCVGFSLSQHPFSQRLKSHSIFKDNYLAAVRVLENLNRKSHVEMNHNVLIHHRKQSRWRTWSRPTL